MMKDLTKHDVTCLCDVCMSRDVSYYFAKKYFANKPEGHIRKDAVKICAYYLQRSLMKEDASRIMAITERAYQEEISKRNI